jgi:hypothetical protein
MLAPSEGRVLNLVIALFGIIFGSRAFYDSYKGVWRPGGIGSTREPIKAAWYHRVFMVLGGLWAFYVSWIVMRR